MGKRNRYYPMPSNVIQCLKTPRKNDDSDFEIMGSLNAIDGWFNHTED
jgi:hypothetical protein